MDCWANLYRSQDDIKSWHHDNYQDWTPRPPIYKRFFFLVEVVVLFFFVGGEDSGRKNLEGHGRGPMNECMMYLLIGEVLCFFLAVATMIFLVSTSYACSSANGEVGTVPTDSPLWSFTAVVGLAFSVRDDTTA